MKFKNPRDVKAVKSLSVTYGAQSNIWINQELIKNLFFRDFVPGVKTRQGLWGVCETTLIPPPKWVIWEFSY
ncbi:hypothetical protein J6590_052070 [Homalodisca vitripennis]|nr:hypothetical protein J6590_052070 [Homalodisca vitripennis]